MPSHQDLAIRSPLSDKVRKILISLRRNRRYTLIEQDTEKIHGWYTSKEGDFFPLQKLYGTRREFRPTRQGLYASHFLDLCSKVAIVNTVVENMNSYTWRKIKVSTNVRRLMSIFGQVSKARMRQIVARKQLRNYSITR